MNDPFEAYRKSKSYSFIDSRIGKHCDVKLRYRSTTYKLNRENTSGQSQHVKNKMNQSGLDGAKRGKTWNPMPGAEKYATNFKCGNLGTLRMRNNSNFFLCPIFPCSQV